MTERLVLRCWDPRDAPLLKEAVDSSPDHLRPWMPWDWDEPQPLTQKAELLRRFRSAFDLGEDFVYAILEADEAAVVGGTGLHRRVGEGALEIGYWIRASRIGEGLATESAAALTRVAFESCGVDRVETRVTPENTASLAVPPKVGYAEEATLRRRLPGVRGQQPRDVVVSSLFRERYAATPAARVDIAGYDALGERVL